MGRVPLAPMHAHRRRILTAGKIGIVLVVVSLVVGMAGYMGFEGMGAIDAFLNAAMILSGMGPLYSPQTVAGKLFAGLYALYSGFAVLGIAAVMLAPVVHRTFHRLHIADVDDNPKS